MSDITEQPITTRAKADAGEDWNNVSARLNYLPFEYMSEMVDYYYLTMTESSDTAENHSMIIDYAGEPVAIWPLWVLQKNGEWSMLNHGYVKVFPPLITEDASDKIHKKITKWCVEFAENLAREKDLEQWQASDVLHSDALPLWHRLLMEHGAEASVRHTMMIDLTPSLQDIKSGFRKSFKSLVNKLPSDWRLEVMDTPSEEQMEQFRQLHIAAAGKETRDKASWELQRQICLNNKGFIIFLYDRDELIGASLFFYTTQEGFYGVGAYARERFDQPIGHVIQMEAIKQFKERNVTHYRIGDRYYLGDKTPSSQKEIDISFFKEGFGVDHHVIMDYEVPLR